MRVLLPLLLSSLLLTACASSPTPPRPPANPAEQVSVLTYNLNYGIAGDPDTIAAIREADADLVLLQETTPDWQRSLDETLSEQYPHRHFHHCCGAGGLAVLSKHPFTSREPLSPPDGGWFPALPLTVDTALGALDVLVVHLRPPLSEHGSVVSGYFATKPIRAREISHYFEHLQNETGDRPDLVVGDFNEDHGQAIAYLEAQQMRSTLLDLSPAAKTWRWQTRLGEVTQRLDHIVYDRQTLRPFEATVLQAGNSDHLPVLARFTTAQD